MRTFYRISLAATLAFGLTVTAAHAQQAKQFGILGGVDFASFTGSNSDGGALDLGGTTLSINKGSLTGFIGGLYFAMPVGDRLMFEPELLYEGKGAKYATDVDFDGTTVSGDLDFDLHYISVPLLVRYQFTSNGGPYAIGGFSVNFNVSCSIKWSGAIADSLNSVGFPTSTDCPDMETYYGDNLGASTTFGGVIGLGFQKERFGLEGRYDFDFGDAYDNVDGVKNAAWEILARIMVK